MRACINGIYVDRDAPDMSSGGGSDMEIIASGELTEEVTSTTGSNTFGVGTKWTLRGVRV